jgi:DNA-binding transcriptional LysR family regulator
MIFLLSRQQSLFVVARKSRISAPDLCENARMIDWQDLRYFAVLARAGSLSAAARELGVDHATIGRRVASLEQALALRLVTRLPRTVRLTPEGEEIAALAEPLADAAGAIERRARALATPLRTTVRISAPPALAARAIAPKIVDFHRAHPTITPVLAGVPHHAALDRGEAEIAVRLHRPDDSELVIKRIGVLRFALYATPENAAKPESEWVFIGYDRTREHVTQQVWLRTLLAGRPMVFQASDLFAQQEAARAGLGAVVLPYFMGDRDPALVRLPVGRPPPTRDIWIATYPDLRRSAAIRIVLDFLIATIGDACPIVDRDG